MKIIHLSDASPVELSVALESGAVLVLPTDTVYGLVCDASNKKAVSSIFTIKNRDKKNPLPIFVKDIEMAKEHAEISREQEKILKKSWPGAITFILPAKKKLSPLVYKDKTIAMRMPDYELIGQIFNEFNRPLAQTSANISGHPATTDVKEAVKYLGSENLIIIDAGYLPDNKPSTIVDLIENKNKILRK